jgi:heme-degrading monooxygenase HmoA
MADHYASGNWHVTKGKEKEFVERWTEFLQWTRKDHPAMVRATLIQDADDKSHFVSTSEWENADARTAWKQSPEFMKKFGAARALCDEMSSIDADRRVTI